MAERKKNRSTHLCYKLCHSYVEKENLSDWILHWTRRKENVKSNIFFSEEAKDVNDRNEEKIRIKYLQCHEDV